MMSDLAKRFYEQCVLKEPNLETLLKLYKDNHWSELPDVLYTEIQFGVEEDLWTWWDDKGSGFIEDEWEFATQLHLLFEQVCVESTTENKIKLWQADPEKYSLFIWFVKDEYRIVRVDILENQFNIIHPSGITSVKVSEANKLKLILVVK